MKNTDKESGKLEQFGEYTFPVYRLNTLVIGSGAAALNAALNLHRFGIEEVAIVTADLSGGTSRNAGSDKQTYYKLSLAGDKPDSPRQMAEDLFKGGSMHGDIALCEAQYSAQAFFNLVQLGVPFPHDRYGAYVGYRTDHERRQRATSAGPLTSRKMVEVLLQAVREKGIAIFDQHEIISLLTGGDGADKRVLGAIAIDGTKASLQPPPLVLFNARNIILGSGGPGGLYRYSVYPEDQLGSHGLALRIGARAQNLTESQYGLASLKYRWNLSGTYQQAIPRYLSTDRHGRNEHEFLNDFYPDASSLAGAIFSKGYQWPFDPAKVTDGGSSLIDLLVYRETVIKKRRVFLDYRHNPGGSGWSKPFELSSLPAEARDYLEKSEALGDNPFARLQKMNPPAIELFRNQGIHLDREYLEIAVCAQHSNGGLSGNIWWESNIKHLFPVGEVNGSHGVYRPGGSALNAGQVGAIRSSLYISRNYRDMPPDSGRFSEENRNQVQTIVQTIIRMSATDRQKSSLKKQRHTIQERMSACAAQMRNPEQISAAVASAREQYNRMLENIKAGSVPELIAAFKNLDLCLSHTVFLEAIDEYLDRGGQSRGSYIVHNPAGEKCHGKLDWAFRLNGAEDFVEKRILEIWLDEQLKPQKRWLAVRPVPQPDNWFEKVWEQYRSQAIIT